MSRGPTDPFEAQEIGVEGGIELYSPLPHRELAPGLPIEAGVWTRRDLRPLPLIGGTLLLLAGCGDGGGGPTQPETPPLVITTSSLEPGSVGQLYAEGVNAEGGQGDFFWELISGELPPGIAISVDDLAENDLLVTGIPETAGTFTFALEVSTPAAEADTAQFTLEVLPPPTDLRISNLVLPPTTVGLQTAIPLETTGSGGGRNPTWSLVRGALPPGLELQPSGVITGTATAAGDFVFAVGVHTGSAQTFRRFTLRVIPNDTDRFRLTMLAVIEIPAEIRPHVDEAFALWEKVIVGDLAGESIPSDFFSGRGCAGFGKVANGAGIDDVLVLVNVDSIDGPGQVLAQAGPCAIRDDVLPLVGALTLDSSDLMPITGTTTLTAVIAHEIGHVLGFGSLWQALGLLEGAGTADPRFTGERAVAEWQRLGGEGAVPVENEGGAGTRDSHLREIVFNREMMTGFSEPVGVQQPLSAVSIGAMADLGFTVDMSAADPFTLPAETAGFSAFVDGHLGWDIVGVGPVRTLGGVEVPVASGGTR